MAMNEFVFGLVGMTKVIYDINNLKKMNDYKNWDNHLIAKLVINVYRK